MSTEQLSYTQIRINGGTQMRAGTNHDTVGAYADIMRHNNSYDPFPPIIVYFDGADYWLGDGFHRHAAAFQAFGSACAIPAEVRAGTRRDAVLHAAGANAEHGLQRTPQDKRRAVQALLLDDEWRTWSNYKVADACRVSEAFVRKIKGELNIETTHETQYIHPRTGQPATMNTQRISQSDLSTKINKLEFWLMGKGWSRSSGLGIPTSINKEEHCFEWNRDDEKAHFGALKNAETIQLAKAANVEKIYELRAPGVAAGRPAAQSAAADAPSQPNETALAINGAVELVWAALSAEKFHPPILPAKITSLKNSPEVAFTRYLRPGETVTDDTLYAAKGKVEAALILQMEHCNHDPWPASPALSPSNRCDICGKPVVASTTLGPAITETLDEAVRRATSTNAGKEQWQALAATGADYWQILDLLKSTITSTGGTAGPGWHDIEWRSGPIVTISQGAGGPVVAKLMSGRLVEAVRRAWAIPEKAGAQSPATQSEDDEWGPLCSVSGCYQSAIAERDDGSLLCACHVDDTEDSAGEAAAEPLAPSAPIRETSRALLNGSADDRLFLAKSLLNTISVVLDDLPVYSTLTGKFTEILPAERSLKLMRDELQHLVESLSPKRIA